MPVELSNALLAAILAAQVAQLGFEGRLIQRLSKLEVKVATLRKKHYDKNN